MKAKAKAVEQQKNQQQSQNEQILDLSQSKVIESIFNQFKDVYEDVIYVDEFLDVLQRQGLEEKCLLLVKRLEVLEEKALSYNQFQKLFTFSINQTDIQNFAFEMIDVDGSDIITKTDLKIINQTHQLGLTEQDMDHMMTYTTEQFQPNKPVNIEVFRQIIKQ